MFFRRKNRAPEPSQPKATSSDSPLDKEANRERQFLGNMRQARERVNVIRIYGKFLEHNPGGDEIRDVKCLPCDKNVILNAICSQIVAEDDPKLIEQLKVGALFLADFQEGIGAKPLSSLGIDIAKDLRSGMSKDELDTLADRVANNPDRKRYEKYKAIVDKNFADIKASLLAAELLRCSMPEQKKREVLGKGLV